MTDEETKMVAITRAYKRIFATDDGQLVLDDLKRKTNYDRSSLPADRSMPIDLNRILVDEAQWQVVHHIVRQVAKDLDNERPKQTESEKEL